MKKEEVKEKPSLKGGRSLFTTPQAEKCEIDGLVFLVSPLKMIARSRWSGLSRVRYAKEQEFWTLEDSANKDLYTKRSKLVNVQYKGEIDPEKKNLIWSKAFDKMAENEESIREFLEISNTLENGRKYAFSEFTDDNWYLVFDTLADHCKVIEDGKELQLTREVIENRISYEQLVFLCGKIDEVSTLSLAEVLGLG